MNILVIDFGGTLAKYSVLDETLYVHARGELPAPTGSKEDFVRCVQELCTQHQAEDLSGIAVSLPGAIDSEYGYAHTAGSYIHLYDTNIRELLEEATGLPVSVENDGKCGALAEVWKGGLEHCQDGAVIILGTGIGGGIIKDRKVHKGMQFKAGELSFLVLDPEAGLRGTAFYKCSMSCLLVEACLRKGIDIRKQSTYPLLSSLLDFGQTEEDLTAWNEDPAYENGMDGLQFFTLLEQGDPDAAALYKEFTRSIAQLIEIVQTVFAPEKVLIGGGVCREPRLIPDIIAERDRLCSAFDRLFEVPGTIERCQYGNEANQYGAVYNFLQQH